MLEVHRHLRRLGKGSIAFHLSDFGVVALVFKGHFGSASDHNASATEPEAVICGVRSGIQKTFTTCNLDAARPFPSGPVVVGAIGA